MRKLFKIIASVLVLAFLVSITFGFQPVNAQTRRETKIYGEDSNSFNLSRSNRDNTIYQQGVGLLQKSSNIAIIDEDIYLLYEKPRAELALASIFSSADKKTQNDANKLYKELTGTDSPYHAMGEGLISVAHHGKLYIDPLLNTALLGGVVILVFGIITINPYLIAAGAVVTLSAWMTKESISPAFDTMEKMGSSIVNNPTAKDYWNIAELEPVDAIDPIYDSELILNVAQHFTLIAECNQLSKAIIDSISRIQVAVDAKEAEYVLLQSLVAVNYIALLEDNLIKQKELILIQKLEGIDMATLEGLKKEFDIKVDIDYESIIEGFKEMNIHGIDEEKRTMLIEAGLSKEEIQFLETIIADTTILNDLDIATLDAVHENMDKYLEAVDGILGELIQMSILLNKFIGLLESAIIYPPQIEYLYNTGGGGGVYIDQNSTATLKGNTISNNTAKFGGGILAFKRSSVAIEDNITSGNSAKYGGGILVGFDSSATIDGNTIKSNVANQGAGLLVFMNSSAIVTGNLIDDNSASYNGGSVWVNHDSVLGLASPDDNTYISNIPEDIFYHEAISEAEEYVYFEETLIKVDANPERGFNWGYYLYIPESASGKSRFHLLVGPNNTGYPHDDLSVHDDSARQEATGGFKNVIAKQLGVPLLVPVFPRFANEWWIYTHSLDRNTLMVKEGRLARIDLQLIAMIEDAKLILKNQGLNVEEKVFMKGYSACSTFSNRFTILHPHIVKAVASGGINSIPTFPTEEWDGERLRYPVGIADIKEIAGIEFDLNEYMKVAQYIYMGSEDDNDTTPFDDAYERVDARLIWRVVGKEMDVRWEKSEQIYKELGIPAKFVTYQGVGHTITPQKLNDVVAFFEANTND